MMKSRLLSIRAWIEKGKAIATVFDQDKLTVYAAQASFFIVISAIPFLMLLLSLSRYLIPFDSSELLNMAESILPKSIMRYIADIAEEVLESSALPIVSVTALTTLWSASRGVNAVGSGIRGVYGVSNSRNFLYDILRSLFYTVAFIAILLVSLVVLVFGRELSYMLSDKYAAATAVLDFLIRCRIVIFSAVLTLFFSMVYSAMMHGGTMLVRRKSEKAMRFRDHLPGAFIAALGWMIYSFFYSLYLKYFPSASYIYGSLAAVVLLMLWLYFCMIILLVGAEINKYLKTHVRLP